MDADIKNLYESDFYRITDFRCRCNDCVTSQPEYSRSFAISFVRKGNFLFNVFRRSLDSYSGCVLITKPGYERTVTHTHDIPDQCTIFDFKSDFYATLIDQYGHLSFFKDSDVHSTLLKTKADLEFLHYHVLRLVLFGVSSRLEIDNLVMEIVERVLPSITDYKPDLRIDAKLKRNHLQTIERAKEYMTDNYGNDISLAAIATYCHVSPFHFSRLFKTFTTYSPHQYLLSIRLQHARLLLSSTTLPISDIAFSSGFNSAEHFNAAFRQQYNCAPTNVRQNGKGTPAALTRANK